LPLWDVEDAIEEVRRVSAKGCHAVSFPEAPHALGLPSFYSGHWDPLIEAITDTETVMCLHIGVSGRLVRVAPEAPADSVTVLSTQLSVMTSNDLLWGPTFRKYPGLRVALSEGGIGWIPFYLERCDRHYENRARYSGQDFGEQLPSEVFREHVLACFITDPSGLRNRDFIGIDMIAWECDFPHSDATWPRSPELLMAELRASGVRDDEVEAITWRNSSRFFGYDPFSQVSREHATVGALRALARDVDTSTVPRAEWRRRYAERTGIQVVSTSPRPSSTRHPNASSE
jgi:predicted TIM-barrel fold metal-dependent hydrolase